MDQAYCGNEGGLGCPEPKPQPKTKKDESTQTKWYCESRRAQRDYCYTVKHTITEENIHEHAAAKPRGSGRREPVKAALASRGPFRGWLCRFWPTGPARYVKHRQGAPRVGRTLAGRVQKPKKWGAAWCFRAMGVWSDKCQQCQKWTWRGAKSRRSPPKPIWRGCWTCGRRSGSTRGEPERWALVPSTNMPRWGCLVTAGCVESPMQQARGRHVLP